MRQIISSFIAKKKKKKKRQKSNSYFSTDLNNSDLDTTKIRINI